MSTTLKSPCRLSPIYAITDEQLLLGNELFAGVTAALEGGIKTIQLRNKTAPFKDKLDQAMTLRELCDQFSAQLIVNDDIEVAKLSGAHGVHLGQDDTPIKIAREQLGNDCIIGITCHSSLHLAQIASENGADYVAFGRFFSSSTKPQAQMAPLSIIETAKRELSLPVVAIGGITRDNMNQVIRCGANSLAVCHGLFAAKDIKKQAQLMLEQFEIHNL